VELLLNSLWLAIAAATLLSWLRALPTRRSQVLLGLGALSCMLILLLPAVSITDDLHLQKVAVEDARWAKRISDTVPLAAHLYQPFWLALASLALLFAMTRQPQWLVNENSTPEYLSPLFSRSAQGRAPPALCPNT
jgi:hypothetical protein